MSKHTRGGIIRALLEDRYRDAERVMLIMDQLNTHSPASLYEVFGPEEAKRLADRLEVHHTPKHGSRLNMAEIELSVLARQVLSRARSSSAVCLALGYADGLREPEFEHAVQNTDDDGQLSFLTPVRS